MARMKGGLCTEKPQERDHLKDLGIDGWITLKLVLNKSVMTAWTWWIWLKIGGDEHSGFKKCGELLE